MCVYVCVHACGWVCVKYESYCFIYIYIYIYIYLILVYNNNLTIMLHKSYKL